MEKTQERLNNELSKPATEINANLVKELLDELKVEPPTEEVKQKCWESIIKKMEKSRSPKVY